MCPFSVPRLCVRLLLYARSRSLSAVPTCPSSTTRMSCPTPQPPLHPLASPSPSTHTSTAPPPPSTSSRSYSHPPCMPPTSPPSAAHRRWPAPLHRSTSRQAPLAKCNVPHCPTSATNSPPPTRPLRRAGQTRTSWATRGRPSQHAHSPYWASSRPNSQPPLPQPPQHRHGLGLCELLPLQPASLLCLPRCPSLLAVCDRLYGQ